MLGWEARWICTGLRSKRRLVVRGVWVECQALLCLAGHAQEPTGLPALYNRVSHLCAFAMSFMAGTYLFHGMGLHASSASRSRTPAATMFVSLLPSVCTAVWFFLFRFFARLFQERRQEGFSCGRPAGLLHGPCWPGLAGHDFLSAAVAVHAGFTGVNDAFHMNGPCPERFETPLPRCTRVCSLRLFFVLVVVLAIGDLRMKATAHLTFKQLLFHPMGCQNLSKLGWQMGQI